MSLSVYVQVWCEIDTALNLRVDRQTALPVVDDGDTLMLVAHLGRSGISAALQLPDAEITAFAIGEGHEDALRHALAAGAKFALKLQVDAALDNVSVLNSLAEWLKARAPDLVIADTWGGQVAARLGWAHLAGLSELRYEGNRYQAIRLLDRGAFERVTARQPAIVRLQRNSAKPEYVSRARIKLVESGDYPITCIPFENIIGESKTAPGLLQVTRPRTKTAALPVGQTAAKASDRLSALMGLGPKAQAKTTIAAKSLPTTSEEMADEFVRYLAHHQLL